MSPLTSSNMKIHHNVIEPDENDVNSYETISEIESLNHRNFAMEYKENNIGQSDIYANSDVFESSYPRKILTYEDAINTIGNTSEQMVSQEHSHIMANVIEDDDDYEDDVSSDGSVSTSSSYCSSWCSSVVVPVIRPMARRAPSPTPEAAFAFSGPPAQNTSYGCVEPIGSKSFGVFRRPSGFSGEQDVSSQVGNNSISSKQDEFSLSLNTPVEKDQDDKRPHFIPCSPDKDVPNLGLSGCCGISCGDLGIKGFSQFDPVSKSMDSSILPKRNSGIHYNSSFTRSAWWIRRQARTFTSGRKRRRRSSPVFDNMPVVPESPTVSTCSSDDVSDTDESPLPLSPPGTEATSPPPLMDQVELELGADAHAESNCNAGSKLSYHVSCSYSENAIAANSTFSQSIQHGPSSYISTPSKSVGLSCNQCSVEYSSTHLSNDLNVPMFVTCNDHEDDNYSMSSWASHSVFRSDYSTASFRRGGSSVPNSASKSVSSESLSLPVMIGPAYKFTPIDRDCSYSEAGSYEKYYAEYDDDMLDYDVYDNEYDKYNECQSEGLMAKPAVKYEDKVEGNDVLWSVYDMPLLLSKIVCDWASGNN